MRLTPEFVSKSQSHLNPLKERELDLRGLAIPVIENLASHQGTYDTLNLTDNSLTVLGNIPLATRLHSIHAANNQISSIAPSLPNAIPNLASLTLTANNISTLGTLLPLADLRSLRYLSLRGNPVAEHEHYRLFTVWKVARGQLHVLDFARVTDAERAEAKALFTDAETGRPNELANKLSIQTVSAVAGATAMAAKAVAARGGAGAGAGGKGRLMTPDEKKRVLEALTRAETADEVRKLERMLADGLIPEGESVAAATAVVA